MIVVIIRVEDGREVFKRNIISWRVGYILVVVFFDRLLFRVRGRVELFREV